MYLTDIGMTWSGSPSHCPGAATCLDCRFFLFCQSVKGDSIRRLPAIATRSSVKKISLRQRTGEYEERHLHTQCSNPAR